jgi:uncharacterized protein with beta-barrel porin domain
VGEFVSHDINGGCATGRSNLRLLLASSSVAALLIGCGTPSALAAPCTNTVTAAFDNPIATTVANVCVHNTSFTGSITNEGKISPSGIAFQNGTITGKINSAGVVNGGISLDATSKITATQSSIEITGTSFTGGISNAGTLSAGKYGIDAYLPTPHANPLFTFSGGITNSGTITVSSSSGDGIYFRYVPSVFGGISNSGAITSGGGGINVYTAAQFGSTSAGGGITNSGTISARTAGIEAYNVTTFSGGITNTGTIIVAGSSGIYVRFASVFSGGISNSGTISVGGRGIFVSSVTQFGSTSAAGGITNSGRVTANTSGIAVEYVTTFSGGIVNSGTVAAATYGIDAYYVTNFSGGITNSGKITSGYSGILVDTAATFSGGISNSGTISAGKYGIDAYRVTNFSGGITNSGAITVSSSSGYGIYVAVDPSFFGGISNSGAITSGGKGIYVSSVTQFGSTSAGGGITNSGTISAGGTGIYLATISTFAGGISNSGTITGAQGIVVGTTSTSITSFSGGISNGGRISATSSSRAGILVINVLNFSGGITNSGTIVSASSGIALHHLSTFTGGITNSGTISAVGSGITVGQITSFSGGITNSGTISAGRTGIFVNEINTFAGGIGNSGTITGATGIYIDNSVTFAAGSGITNTGTIIGTTAAIDASAATSAVTINLNGGLVSGAVKLSSHADVLNINGGTIAGNIVGKGSSDTVNFQLGAGTTYTDSNSFTGVHQVNINSGTVLLNGTDTATNIDVFSGATLGGTGTLDPNMTIHGGATFAPGVPGTFMQVTGSLALQSAAVYLITINGANASGAAITGTATISPGALAAGNPASSNAIIGNTYTIMTATSVSGVFADPKFFFGRYEGVLSYGPTYVELTVENGALSPVGAPQNALNVANGINNAIQNGVNLSPGFTNLFNFTPQQLNNALTGLEGQPETGAATSAFQLMTDFLNLLTEPSSGGGANPTGGGASGFAPENAASLPSDVAQAYASILTKAPPQQQTFEQRWTAWGSAFGDTGKLDGDSIVGSNSVTASDYGYAAGMDYHATPDSVYGFALAGGGTNWSIAQALGSGRSDSFQAGLHDTTHWGPFYLTGALAFANHWFTTNRTVLGDQLTARFVGQDYAARGEAGYRYAVPITGQVIGVTPYAAMQVQDFHIPGFSETDLTGGGLGLAFAARNATDTRSELGARFDNLQVVYGMPLVLRARLAWAHDWVSNPSLGAVFQALPGSNFTVYGAAPPPDSALTTASAELHINANWTAIAKFDGGFAPTAQTYAGTGKLKYSW